jgi:hypothetical protein
VPIPYYLQMAVYNSAGERVKVIFEGGVSGSPVGSRLAPSLLSTWDAQLDIVFPDGVTTQDGTHSFSWDGNNQQGQGVSNGMYWIKFDVYEPNSHLTTWTLGAQVVRPMRTSALGVYNTAGERIARLDLPAGADASTFRLEAPSGTRALIHVDTSSGPQVLVWDGMGGQGSPAAAGSYLIRAETDGLSRGEPFVLLKAPLSNGSLVAAPNPLGRGQGAWLITFEPRPGAQANAWVFNVAGERVRAVRGPADGRLWLPAEGLAGGYYLLVLEVDGSAPYRQKAKLAVAR